MRSSGTQGLRGLSARRHLLHVLGASVLVQGSFACCAAVSSLGFRV